MGAKSIYCTRYVFIYSTMIVILFSSFHGCHAPSLIVKKNSMEISMIINYIEDAYDSVSNQDRYKKLN
jgi:hypothetical protein